MAATGGKAGTSCGAFGSTAGQLTTDLCNAAINAYANGGCDGGRSGDDGTKN
jgi:hypothetical protein